MQDAELDALVTPIVKAVINRITVPMDTRPFGGSSGGILLSGPALKAVEVALRESLLEEFRKHGAPQTDAIYHEDNYFR